MGFVISLFFLALISSLALLLGAVAGQKTSDEVSPQSCSPLEDDGLAQLVMQKAKVPTVDKVSLFQDASLRYHYGETFNGTRVGVSYYNIPKQMEEELFDLLDPQKTHAGRRLRQGFFGSVMSISYHDIFPHVDSGSKVVINAYIETQSCNTTFYHQPLAGEDNGVSNDQRYTTGDGKIYVRERLKVAKTISTNPGDVWILNTNQIHSVECREGMTGPRVAWALHSVRYTFEETKSIFAEIRGATCRQDLIE